jgi:hypothetical protein
VLAVDDNIYFLDELSYCISTTHGEHSNPVRVMQVHAEITSVGQKTLFASKSCVAPIFCVIIPSIYQLTNKLL